MEKRTLAVADVQITAFQQKLLQQPDPQLKGGFRVPIGEGIGYSADDWTQAWRAGSIEFTDAYYLEHKGRQLPKDDLNKLQTYIYLNKLDPMIVQNWELAYDRLISGGVLKPEAPNQTAQESVEPQAPKFIDIEKMPSRTPEERRKLRDANWQNLMLESQPVVDQFFADLNAAGHYPNYDERLAMQTWVQNHNLFPNQRKSWEKALANVTPKYLSDDERAIIAMDHDDNVTAADLKKALGTASPRVGYAVQNR